MPKYNHRHCYLDPQSPLLSIPNAFRIVSFLELLSGNDEWIIPSDFNTELGPAWLTYLIPLAQLTAFPSPCQS